MPRIFLWVVTAFFCLSSLAQEHTYDFTYTLPSNAFNKDRTFYVHLPEDYYSMEEDFGVIYVLDSQAPSFYNNAKGIIDYLVWSYHIMPVIVVGIHSDNRGTEFIPKNKSLDPHDEGNNGQAQLLRDQLKNEIFPHIKQHFRVNDFKAIIGHSRGGAFLANTLFSDQKDLFNAYIAVSPAMHYLDRQILKDAEQLITQKATFNKFYFATYGTVGSNERFFGPQVQYLDSLLAKHPNPTLHWVPQKIDKVSHWGVVAPSINFGLLEMNRAYQIDQYLIEQFAANKEKSISQQINDYEVQQKKKLGFFKKLPASRLRRFADNLGEEEDYQSALELYELSIAQEPNQIRTYFGKSWVLEELGFPEKAIANYEAATALLNSNRHSLNENDTKKWQERVAKELERLKGKK